MYFDFRTSIFDFNGTYIGLIPFSVPTLFYLGFFSLGSRCLLFAFTDCLRVVLGIREGNVKNPRTTREQPENPKRTHREGNVKANESGVWSREFGVRETFPNVSIKTHSGISILLFVNERV